MRLSDLYLTIITITIERTKNNHFIMNRKGVIHLTPNDSISNMKIPFSKERGIFHVKPNLSDFF